MRRLAALLLAGCALAANAGTPTPAEKDAARETEIDALRLLPAQEARLAALGIRLGYVETDTRPGDGMYLCGGMSRDEALGSASTVTGALQAVPDAALARLRLRYVVLCSQALASGQRIGGIPVPPLNLLMLDAGSGDLQHRTLHELYHLVEYRFGSINDADWAAQFGSGYANRYPYQLERSPIGSGKAGFVNAYAETYPHEDRAELFAYLVLTPSAVAAQIRSANDGVLRKKADYLIDKCQRLIGLPVALPN